MINTMMEDYYALQINRRCDTYQTQDQWEDSCKGSKNCIKCVATCNGFGIGASPPMQLVLGHFLLKLCKNGYLRHHVVQLGMGKCFFFFCGLVATYNGFAPGASPPTQLVPALRKWWVSPPRRSLRYGEVSLVCGILNWMLRIVCLNIRKLKPFFRTLYLSLTAESQGTGRTASEVDRGFELIWLPSSMTTAMNCHEDHVMMAVNGVSSGRRLSKQLMLLFKLTFHQVSNKSLW